MKPAGMITCQSGPPGLPFTGEWTANPDATVTRHFGQFGAATGTWAPQFTATYVRKPAP